MKRSASIEDIIAQFRSIVRRDGGDLQIAETSDEGALVIDFVSSDNAECRDCVITPEMLHDFIVDALAAHSIADMSVHIRRIELS